MAAYRDKSDLIAIGAYQRGSDPLTDAAIDARDPIDGFLPGRRGGHVGRGGGRRADPARAALERAAAPPADPASSPPGTPRHSAIPLLHLAA